MAARGRVGLNARRVLAGVDVRRVLAGAGASLALAFTAGAAHATSTWWQRAFGRFPEVRIERTAHGVAHLFAADEAGLGYAWGYAHAQDRGCEVAEALVTAAGERGRWFGAESGTRLGARILDNRTSDFFVRDHLDDAALERAWNALSPEARAFVQGIVDGYDRWVDDLGDPAKAKGVRCAGAAWMRPMTIVDLRRLVELQAVADGEAAWADAITRAQPPGSPSVHEPPPRPPVGLGPGAREGVSRPGGVALAFGREAAGGGALLLGQPHAAWSGADRWWPAHLVIPGRLDAWVVAPGLVPSFAAGFNRGLAWSTTRSAARHLTLHQLVLAPDDPTTYLVDGRREAMTWKRVRTVEREADGVEPVDRALYRTRYGPVVVAPEFGLGWTRGTAYALQDVDVEDARALDTGLAVARAESVPALREALAGRGMGDAVVVAADGEGRVAYADPGSVPDLDASTLGRCLAPGGAGELWAQRGLVVLDGSRSTCDWRRGTGEARRGAIPFARTPWLERTDWVQSSGDSFWLAQPAAPGAALDHEQRAAWSPLQGGDPAPLPLRTRALVRAIERARAAPRPAGASSASAPASASASAPAPAPALDIEALIAIGLDVHDEAALLVRPDLATLCAGAATEATRSGCAAIARWDGRDTVDAVGAVVFREWWRRVQDLPGLWGVPFAASDPLGTPRGLRLSATPDPVTGRTRRRELLEALAQAVFALRQAGFTLDAPLGRVQFVALGADRVALPGGEAVEGAVATIEGRSAVALSKLGYEPDYGTSWAQAVSFGPAGRVARGVLLSPVTSDDDAAARRAALAAWSSGAWFDLPSTPQEIAAQRVGEPLVLKTW